LKLDRALAHSVVVVSLLFAISSTAGAASSPPRGRIDRWGLTFAGFLVNFDTRARWEVSNAPVDALIDLEDILGLEENLTRARLDAVLRVGKRSVLNFEYLRLHRDSNQTVLVDDIMWGDEIFMAGAKVESDFDTDVYKFGWTWSAVKKPRFDLGLSVGISAIYLAAGIRGIATASGGPGSPEFFEEEREEVLAPVPVFGISVGGHLWRSFYLRGHAQYFRFTNDKLKAEFIDTLVAFEYLPFEHVGFGVGYDYFELSYEQDKDDLQVSYIFDGPFVYLRLVY
jgi:hypothetical protein